MCKAYIPTYHAKNIYEITPDFYKKLGIKYILVDLDNTLDSYLTKLPTKEAVELKEKLTKNGIKIIITSNNTGKRVSTYADALGVMYLNSIGKPFPFGINKALKTLGYDKKECILIGDQLMTDIAAGNRSRLKTVLTEKLVEEDQPTTRFNRIFDRPVRKYLLKHNMLNDWRKEL